MLQWLMETAQAPIRYRLTGDPALAAELLDNVEVRSWLGRLEERARSKDLTNIHGSHDYRLETILGKCWMLGLNSTIPAFDAAMGYILDFVNQRVGYLNGQPLSFEKMYSYHDYETVICCYLPLLGYHDQPGVRYIAEKRIAILYGFTRQKRYDLYVDGSRYPGVKKEWQPYLLDPSLYADGNIALPSVHDYILLAGMYGRMDADARRRIDVIVDWLMDHRRVRGRYGYFYAPEGAYHAKSILRNLHLADFSRNSSDKENTYSLVFTCYLLSYLPAATHADWYQSALQCLRQYRTNQGRCRFPAHMIMEKSDTYLTAGGHMNAGENKRSRLYAELLSTYWMHAIESNLTATR